MVTDTLVRQMSGAFEVSRVRFNISFVLYPPFPLGSDFECDRGQELKERSRRKSLFIRHESDVWAALPRQRALVEEPISDYPREVPSWTSFASLMRRLGRKRLRLGKLRPRRVKT
jgi:hypothetical protein